MRLITTREVSRLTGLSPDQLREWTGRRALIPPDVRPRGRGSSAQFSWQTVLLLRLAASLRDHFRIELQSHGGLFVNLRLGLARKSFVELWSKWLLVSNDGAWELLDGPADAATRDDFILIRLDPHLDLLSNEFALPQRSRAGQLDLFPALSISTRRAEIAAQVYPPGAALSKIKRRSHG